jgi:hypothetical protein
VGVAILVPSCLSAEVGVVVSLPFGKDRQCVIMRGTVTSCLQVGVILVGKGHLGGLLHLLLVVLHGGLVDLDLRGSESRGGNELLEGC